MKLLVSGWRAEHPDRGDRTGPDKPVWANESRAVAVGVGEAGTTIIINALTMKRGVSHYTLLARLSG